MAKRNNDQDGADKGTIRLLYAEVSGNNQSLQDAMKTFVAAMSPQVRVVGPGGRISNKSPAALGAPENASEVEEVEVEEANLDEADEAVPPMRKQRGQGPKKDWNEGIKIVADLNFRPDGKQTMREFDAEKAPKTDQERVAVIVFYMHNIMGQSQIGLGHILTAFRDIGEPVPSDLRSTVKKCKAKAWLKYADVNDIQLATGGENLVVHDLPHKSK